MEQLDSIFTGPDSDILYRIIFNPNSPEYEFYTTYAISIISAALGLAKCLKNGVARPIAPGGPLDGLLTAKFIVAFLAIGVGLVLRAICFGVFYVSYQKKNVYVLF